MPRGDLIQVRRDTAANWTSTNPVLESGEAGLETDTRKLKYGDGTSTWAALQYSVVDLTGATLLGNPINATELSRLSGVTSNVQTQLDSKAASSHSHTISNVTSLQASLDAKAATSHAHAIADTTGLQAALDAKAATSHTHAIADSTGLQAALDAKGSQASVDAKLAKAGGTMTGPLILAAAPVLALEPVTKGYFESVISVGPTAYHAKSNAGGAGTQLAGDGSSEDAVKNEALWQYVADNGGGRIFYPRGIYLFSRALQVTGSANAQCRIPQVSRTGIPVTIDCIGETTPPATLYDVNLNPTGAGFTIFKSTLTGASGTASMIRGIPPSGQLFSQVMVNFDRIVIETPDNPTFTALDFSNGLGNRVERTLIYAGLAREFHNEPTNSNSFGIKLPPLNHSSYIWVEGLVVIGFYTGVRLGELTTGTMIVQGCKRGVEAPTAPHASNLTYLGLYGCPNGISTVDAQARLVIGMLDIQHDDGVAGAWQNAAADIADGGNALIGHATARVVQASGGATGTCIKVGGTNFTVTELA